MSKYSRVKFLLEQGAFSVVEITNKLYIADPRSSIRVLRSMGVPVGDYWVHLENGIRFKKYFIRYGTKD